MGVAWLCEGYVHGAVTDEGWGYGLLQFRNQKELRLPDFAKNKEK